MLGRTKREGNPVHCWRNCKVGAATVENNMDIPQKIKNRTIIRSSNSTLGSMSEGNKNAVSKRCLHPTIRCNIILYSKHKEATQISNNRWTDKENDVYVYNGTLFSF